MAVFHGFYCTFIVFLVSCGCLCSVSLPRGAASRSMICDCGIFERKIKQSFKPVTAIVKTNKCRLFIIYYNYRGIK